MRFSTLLVSAMLMGSMSLSNAQTKTQEFDLPLTVSDGFYTGVIGSTFTSADKGKSFLDIYNFDLKNISDVDSGFFSIATFAKNIVRADLNITSFELYSGTNFLMAGEIESDAKTDTGMLSSYGLSSGAYSIRIGGTVVGINGGSYGGNVNISPVPEPETWSMFVAGIATVGFMARRRSRRQSLGATVTA